MNIYLVKEDGETFCIKAKTMAQAISICEISYLEEAEDEEKENYNEQYSKVFYYENILQSCSLVGQLKN